MYQAFSYHSPVVIHVGDLQHPALIKLSTVDIFTHERFSTLRYFFLREILSDTRSFNSEFRFPFVYLISALHYLYNSRQVTLLLSKVSSFTKLG